MTLKRYAFTIAGPRDFLINLAINSALPWWFTRGLDEVPLLGNPSLLTAFGPMGLFLFSFTTVSGCINGMKHRQGGQTGPLLPPPEWLRRAARAGLARGLLVSAVTSALILGAAWLWPDLRVSRTLLIAVQAALAAILAYIVQVSAMLQTRKL